MRTLVTNRNDDFRVKAYAGVNGVLLAFDLSAARRNKLLGFAIQKKKPDAPWQWLFNSLTFPDQPHTFPQWNATPSNLAPFQKFRWADYGINPGTIYSYRVYLVYGSAAAPRLDESLEVTLVSDDGQPDGQHVMFNRAVAASQAFGRKFPEMDKLLAANKNMAIEDWPEAPRNWLQNGLLDRIINFIARATDSSWALDVAIYEYELAAIVSAVDNARGRGAQIRVLYHAKNRDHQTAQNEASLSTIPASQKRGRITSRIFHDKFIVLSQVDARGGYAPRSVLCGSTNFTENGVYRQANVVHIADDAAIAGNYLSMFDVIWNRPADVGATRKWINKNNPIDPDTTFFAGFSPRSGGADIEEFAAILRSASRDLLFATAFALPEVILDAMLGTEHDAVLRYGIQNTASRITGYHADRSADFTTPAILANGLDGWIKEGLKGQRGNLLVHLKVIVVNFTSEAPVIISGSHNFSKPASNGNDENYLIMRGDTDLADRYGLEVLRFYEHYRFRYYAKKLALKQVRPLATDDGWSDAYYQENNLKALSRVRFSGR